MDPQQIYVDTTNGALSYLTPASTPPNTFSAGAIVVNFLHLGQGKNLTSPIPGEDPDLYVNAAPGMGFPLLSALFSPIEKDFGRRVLTRSKAVSIGLAPIYLYN